MSSVTSRTSQIPSIIGYFKTDIGNDLTYVRRIPDPPGFKIGTGGVVAIDGGNVYFDTYANAQTALIPSTAGIPSDGEFYRDMGKEYTIFVMTQKASGLVPQHVATITKLQRYTTPGQNSEGVTGTATAASENWQCYYFVTWSANGESVTGIPVGVVRTGYQ